MAPYTKTEPSSIQTLFNHIAGRYDRANLLLSLGLHKQWNLKLVQSLLQKKPTKLLDLCAGTGDIALSFLKKSSESKALLIDFSAPMLEVANEKGTAFKERFSTQIGNVESLEVESASFDAVSIAYGIRNVLHPEKCLAEVRRVLGPGGRCAILELTRPQTTSLHFLHQLYLRTFVPLLGKWVTSDKEAYAYLCRSIEQFLAPAQLEEMLLNAGFRSLRTLPLSGGIATLFLADL